MPAVKNVGARLYWLDSLLLSEEAKSLVILTDDKSGNLHQERGRVIWTFGGPGSTSPANDFDYSAQC
jgi:hypothetical protein